MRLFLLILTLGACVPNLSAKMERGATAGSAKYLTPAKIEFWRLVPAPPKEDSTEQTADMATLLWLQKTRSPEDVATAQRLSILGLEAFEDIIGESMTGFNEAAMQQMIKDVSSSLAAIVYPAKDNHKRPRPYATSLEVEPCVELEESFSYPSGHAMAGMVYAMLLADLMPEHKEAILRRGHEIGYYRVVGGVHYPSDVLAGQRVGVACAEVILSGTAWQSWKDFTARKK